jgi:hypothetical protein
MDLEYDCCGHSPECQFQHLVVAFGSLIGFHHLYHYLGSRLLKPNHFHLVGCSIHFLSIVATHFADLTLVYYFLNIF